MKCARLSAACVGGMSILSPLAMVTKFPCGTLLMRTPMERVYTRPSSSTAVIVFSPWFSTIRPHNLEACSAEVVQSPILDALWKYRECYTCANVDVLPRELSGIRLFFFRKCTHSHANCSLFGQQPLTPCSTMVHFLDRPCELDSPLPPFGSIHLKTSEQLSASSTFLRR